ncbi:aminoglycoside phosphotransferase family protein [Streptomyces sp. NPDC058231]|uniref:aminoglycoside phosphotransferase family protein n=1 Tax=Streptomyces sp. NPDC058231 TaxID=3346392 RepID=UPI0036E3C36C
MRHDMMHEVDRGPYESTVTPWEQETWREAALRWAEQGLAAHGLRETGRRSVRVRPWSVLVRMPVAGQGSVWFKANPPASSFEAGLGEALARWVPDHVLRPLAVDAERGWSLLPDGGTLFADVLGDGPAAPRAWEEPLRQYADMQRKLIPYAERLDALGVPSGRTTVLPELFDRLVEANTALESSDREALRALRPLLLDWCAELAGTGIGDSLDHSDLHESQLFAPGPGRFTFFDWGDATVAHPFTSLLVTARVTRARYGPQALPRLRDAYLEPWTGDGRTAAELRRAVSLACRVGAIGRAGAWGRLFPGTYGGQGGAGSIGDPDVARWLRELLSEPLL